MAQLNPSIRVCARASLVILWLATAAVSILELRGRSQALLLPTVLPADWHDRVIYIGALLDAAVGLVLWRWHRPFAYLLAAANLLVMVMAATALMPGLWLDPLGSLTKSLPVAALIWVLYEDAR